VTARKTANDIDFNGRKGENLGAPTDPNDTARKTDVDTAYGNAIARANHTGQQAASTISDFNTAVRTNRLDQLTAPTGSVGLNSQKITSLLDPTSAQDAATKNYVDNAVSGLASGLQFKGTVLAAVDTNVTVSNPGTSTFDGATATSGQSVILLTGQSTGSQNGPYLFNGSASSMTRAGNWDTIGEAQVGSFWVITGGVTNPDSFAIMTNDTFTLGTTTAAFQFISVAPAGVAPVGQDLGDNSSTQFTITHNFNTRDVIVRVRRNSSPWDEVDVYVSHPTVNTVSIEPDETWSTAAMRAFVSKA